MSGNTHEFFQEYVASALAVMCATALTNPLDVAKVRLQMQGAAQLGGSESTRQGLNLRTVLISVVKKEKISALWRGTTPGM